MGGQINRSTTIPVYGLFISDSGNVISKDSHYNQEKHLLLPQHQQNTLDPEKVLGPLLIAKCSESIQAIQPNVCGLKFA